MSESYKIEIKGIKELIDKLENSVKPTIIKSSLTQGGALLTAWIKKNRLSGPRPRILGVKSGRLRSSISFSPATQNGNEYSTKIGTNVIYAPIHEFGGRIGKRGKMPARPFLRPSLQDEGNRKQILNILTKNISEALNK